MNRTLIQSLRNVFVSILLLACPIFGSGQVANDLNTGYPENSIFHGSEIENVQLQNGNLHVNIPIWSAAGRGLNTSFHFVYNNHGYRLVTQSFTGGGGFCQDTVGVDPLSPMILKGYGPMDYEFSSGAKSISCGGIFTHSLINVFMREPDGTKHHFSPDPVTLDGTSGCGSGSLQRTLYANDGSGWTIQLDSIGNILYATSKTGLKIGNITASGIPVPLIVDANGNGLSQDPNTHQLSDTLGRVISSDGSYADSTGTQQTPTVVADGAGRPTQITLPNGHGTYGFTYAPTVTTQLCQFSTADQCFESSNGGGEIASITLPTGGQISYTWGNWDEGGREVATRTVTANGVTGVWTYHITNNNTYPPNINAVITDPANKDMTYTLQPTTLGSLDQTEVKQYWDGAANASTLIKTVRTDIDGHSASIWTPQNISLPIRETTTWNQSNLVRKVETDWDLKTVFTSAAQTEVFSWKNPIEVREYDWGAGSPGPLLKRTHYSYRHLEADGTSYFNQNLASLPTLTQMFDGAGNLLAQTQNTYDGTAVASTGNCSTGGAPGHDYCNYGTGNNIRGNLTQSSKWLNTSNTWLSATNSYNDLGKVLTATDPGGHPTTFDYTDNWSGTACLPPSNTRAFATTVTNALGHRVLTSFYPCTSLPQSNKDENDILANGTGTTFTYDLLNRPIISQTLDASGQLLSKMTISYNDTTLPLSVTKTVSGSPSPDVASTVFIDGLGRTLQTLLNDPEGNVTVESTYDALGRKATVTNPHRSVAANTDGTTQYHYDTLGRPTDTIRPDNNTVHTDYAGNVTTVTDETGRQRQSRVDGLGRLIEVDEPGDSFSGAQANGNIDIGEIKTVQLAGSGATSASAQLAIQGIDRVKTTTIRCPLHAPPGCEPTVTTYYDNGKVFVTINGHEYDYFYGNNGDSPDSTSSVAQGLALAINADSARIVNASSSTATLTLTAVTAGTAGNSISYSTGGTWVTSIWPTGPPFTSSPASGSLAGGQNGSAPTTVTDHGTVTISAGGFTSAAVPYGPGTVNTTASSAATALATALSVSGSGVTASTNGGTIITITETAAGTAGNGVSVATHPTSSDPTDFPSPSFAVSPSTLSGGQDSFPSGLAHPYITAYTYDGLDDLTCVEQHGNVSGTGCASSSSFDASSPWRVRRFTYDSLSRLLTSSNPELNTNKDQNGNFVRIPTTYSYNADSILTAKTDARGVTINYSPAGSPIDALHRVTQKTYSDGTPAATFQYDTACCGVTPENPIGRMTAAFSGNTELVFSYDPLGHVKTQWDCPPSGIARGFCYILSGQYDAMGNLVSVTYPDGRNVTTTFNSAGRFTGTKLAGFNGTPMNVNYYAVPQTQSPSSWGYWPTGAMNRGTYGNGVVETTGYNNRLQISSIADVGSATLFSKTFVLYDAAGLNNGDILSITDAVQSAHTQSFSYDSLNRVVSGLQNDNAFNITYSYDPWGNMQESGTSTFLPSYDLTNRLPQPPNCTSANQYCSDPAGNLLKDNIGHVYAYDGEARIKTVDSTGGAYTYNALGNRVRKDAVAGSTEYFFFAGVPLAELNPVNGAWTDYIFGYGKRIAKDTSNNASGAQYYHDDQIGSSRVMTDASGAKVSDCTFNPFGEKIQCSPDNPSNHYWFTGKEHDNESGLDDFGARYYSSSMGRWLSPDWSPKVVPVPYAKLDNPQTLNLYTYVLDDPLSAADPDGHACFFAMGLGTSTSGFCQRAAEYGQFDSDKKVSGQTRFFAAASAVSQALADVSSPMSHLYGMSTGTANFLENIGQDLEKLNKDTVKQIQNGSLSGPDLDKQLVHMEQNEVQKQLDSFSKNDPAGYNKAVSEINKSLNPEPDTPAERAGNFKPTDKAYAQVLNEVRKDLGHKLDFTNQKDREAIGNALIKHIRQTGGCDVNGKMQPGCPSQ